LNRLLNCLKEGLSEPGGYIFIEVKSVGEILLCEMMPTGGGHLRLDRTS
jgi:hypothetical protein